METPDQLVDLTRYPIHSPDSPEGIAFARKCRTEYEQSGLCALPSFILPEALATLANEANSVRHDAYFCDSTHNAYLSDPDTADQDTIGQLPKDDIANRQEHTFVGSVPYDRIPENAALRQLYLWDPLKDFIANVLGKARLHRFADPFGACSINVFVDGGSHGWHFDESEFTVTLMLQPPEKGGEFEYAPLIRNHANEREVVAEILDGKRERVTVLPFTPGTLLIFGGRQTLHRVTKVAGTRPRLVPVLCYSEQPGLQNSESVRQLFWGRTG